MRSIGFALPRLGFALVPALVVVVGYGCGASQRPAANHTASAAPASPPSMLVLDPFRIDAEPDTEQAGGVFIELRPNGAVFYGDAEIGHIAHDRLENLDGSEMMHIAPDGSLMGGTEHLPLSVAADGTVTSRGGTITFAPDGTITEHNPDGTSRRLGYRSVGITPSSLRTAGLLLVAALGVRHNLDERARTPDLAIPARVEGDLEASDEHLSDGSVMDDYRVRLRAGHPVTFLVRGGASTSEPQGTMDMYAILMRSGREVTHDDDSAGHFNPRIVFTPLEDGVYTLRITTYGSGLHTGHYEVETFDGAVPTAQ